MDAIVDIVLPVFCLIGLGYATARLGYLNQESGDGIADFVFKVAVPILLMRSIATAEFADVNPWIFIVVYFSGIAVVWISAMVVMRVLFNRDARSAVISGAAAGYSNLVLLGIPMVERAYGQEGLQILFFLLAIHLPTMMVISTFLMEWAVRADGAEQNPLKPSEVAWNLLRNFMVNPIIIGIFAGIIWRQTGVGISGLPREVMDLLARTTGPLALFSLGMGLIKYGIKGNMFPAAILSILGLMVFPTAIYFVGTQVLPLPILWLKVALLAASCPTGVNAYMFAHYFKVAQGLATNSIVFTTLGGIVTLPFWLSVV